MLRRGIGLSLGDPSLCSAEVCRVLTSARADVLLSFFYPRGIPPDVLSMPKRGAFGTHPSLLPRWRGPDPYYWAIRSGDETTGVTLHRLEASYDTGPIVDTRQISLSADADAWSLARALDRPAATLLVEAARRLDAGESLEGKPQPSEGAWARVPTAEDLAIDWRAPALEVVRAIRAASPEPGATATIGGRWVEVLAAQVTEERSPPGLQAADAWRIASGDWAVLCGDGRSVRLLRARDEEGARLEIGALLRPTGGPKPASG